MKITRAPEPDLVRCSGIGLESPRLGIANSVQVIIVFKVIVIITIIIKSIIITFVILGKSKNGYFTVRLTVSVDSPPLTVSLTVKYSFFL